MVEFLTSNLPAMIFGNYSSFDDFIKNYRDQQEQTIAAALSTLSRDQQPDYLRGLASRDIVEISSRLVKHLPDEKSGSVIHYQLLISLTQIITGDPDVKKDIDRCLKSHENVFVAVRYGDKEGISEPIKHGLEAGNAIHAKGEWITKEKAYSHGGEKMSVLHFTHKPMGFICTPEKCYQ